MSESNGPARDEDALELLRRDPGQFFSLTQSQSALLSLSFELHQMADGVLGSGRLRRDLKSAAVELGLIARNIK